MSREEHFRTGFQALPESTEKLQAVFAWDRFNSMYDFTWEGRQAAFGPEMKSRAPWTRIDDVSELQTGDVVFGGRKTVVVDLNGSFYRFQGGWRLPESYHE